MSGVIPAFRFRFRTPQTLIVIWKSAAASWKSPKTALTITSTSFRKNILASPCILSASPAKSASLTKSSRKKSVRWAEKNTQNIHRLFFTQNLHGFHAGSANRGRQRCHRGDGQYQKDDTKQGCRVSRRNSVQHSGQH